MSEINGRNEFSGDVASYKDRRVILFVIGGLLLVAGIAVGFFGPLEVSDE